MSGSDSVPFEAPNHDCILFWFRGLVGEVMDRLS